MYNETEISKEVKVLVLLWYSNAEKYKDNKIKKKN